VAGKVYFAKGSSTQNSSNSVEVARTLDHVSNLAEVGLNVLFELLDVIIVLFHLLFLRVHRSVVVLAIGPSLRSRFIVLVPELHHVPQRRVSRVIYRMLPRRSWSLVLRLLIALSNLPTGRVWIRRVRSHYAAIATTELSLVGSLARRRGVALHSSLSSLTSIYAFVPLRLRWMRRLEGFLLDACMLLLLMRRRFMHLATSDSWLFTSVLMSRTGPLGHFWLVDLHGLYLELVIAGPQIALMTNVVVTVSLSTACIKSGARTCASMVIDSLLPLVLEAVLPASLACHLVAVEGCEL